MDVKQISSVHSFLIWITENYSHGLYYDADGFYIPMDRNEFLSWLTFLSLNRHKSQIEYIRTDMYYLITSIKIL